MGTKSCLLLLVPSVAHLACRTGVGQTGWIPTRPLDDPDLRCHPVRTAASRAGRTVVPFAHQPRWIAAISLSYRSIGKLPSASGSARQLDLPSNKRIGPKATRVPRSAWRAQRHRWPRACPRPGRAGCVRRARAGRRRHRAGTVGHRWWSAEGRQRAQAGSR